MNALSPEDRRLTLISVTVVFGLSAMSQTVAATAMPRIVAELSGLHLYAWVTTAYMLTSTVSVPIWGKLGDILGRKPILLSGIAIFIVGTWLAGLAGEFGRVPILGGGMAQLIAARAVQGLGGGAVITTALAIVAEIYGPRERARFSGVFGSIFGVCSIVGPVIGGFFTDHGSVELFGHHVAGWRWVFFFNLPFVVPALLLILFRMPRLPVRGAGKIDYLGALLMVAAFVPLLLAVNWGGHSYAWSSPLIIGMFVFGLAALIAFILVERAVWDPILPLSIFTQREIGVPIAGLFFVSMSFLSLSTFLPLFMQVGQGMPATRSGLVMLALLGGMVTSSTAAGQIVARTGHLKPFLIFGVLMLTIGIGLLCFIKPDTSTPDLAMRLLVVGLGLGPTQNLMQVAVQNVAKPHQMGSVVASTQFTRQIGQTIGVALFGVVLTAGLAGQMQGRPNQPAPRVEMADLQRMALQHQDRLAKGAAPIPETPAERRIRENFTASLRHGLELCLAAVVVGLILALLTPSVPLTDRRDPAPPQPRS